MLSILIPSYNHARYVEEAIASALMIDVPGKRIIVIDDASTDGSADLIADYLRRDGSGNIEFIRKPINRGAIDSVITFLSMCTTEYVYFMASDDVAVPSGIELLVSVLQTTQDIQFAIGGGFNVYSDGKTTPIYGSKHKKFFALQRREMQKSIFLDCPSPILCQSSVFRLQAIFAVGGFDPSFIADDYALFTRLFLKYGTSGVNFKYLPETICVRYRHHENNSYRDLPRQALATRQVIIDMAPSLIRMRAAGDRLAYYMLVAIRRRDKIAARKIFGMLSRAELPWFALGLIRNSFKYLLPR